MAEHFDVIIVGAGVSGIGMACHLTRECPKKSFVVLERRAAMGGTWDLFRYPGIRSDSDMLTFGYSFRPWIEPKILADGPSIKQYVIDTAREYGVDKAVRYNSKLLTGEWSSTERKWTITTLNESTGEHTVYKASFVVAASGYYNYDQGYRPDFPGEKDFSGQIIHPQHWPETLDYAGKKVVIIGSGATAVTLVPAMAGKAAHVTMLQRTPTYIASIPSVDEASKAAMRFLPASIVFQAARLRNIGIQRFFYWLARNQPEWVRRLLIAMARRALGKRGDVRHFTPDYNPWDQRLCVVPDGDLFRTIREGRASVVTGHIERFTKDGILLKSGETLPADIIITATGLNVQILGGARISVDGEPVNVSERVTYKAVMLDGVPNAALIFGYTNASWTLKVDIAAEYICRLLNHMDKNRLQVVTPHDRAGVKTRDNVMGALSSGYVRRGDNELPRQGSSGVWKVSNDYISDTAMLKYSGIKDEALEFS